MTRPTDGIQYCQCGHELDDHCKPPCFLDDVDKDHCCECDCPEFRPYTEDDARADRESAKLHESGL